MSVYLSEKKVTVSTSGNAVQLDSAAKTASAIITASIGNSGTIYVGSSSVDASSGLGQPLAAGESLQTEPPSQYGTEELVDLTRIYVDSTSNGDSVVISYYVRGA